jgi:hypothetical protein
MKYLKKVFQFFLEMKEKTRIKKKLENFIKYAKPNILKIMGKKE